MLGSGNKSAVRASATASTASSQDIYGRYAVALYRQALLAPHARLWPGVLPATSSSMNAHWPRYRIAANAVRVSPWSPVRAGDGKPGAPCAGDRMARMFGFKVIAQYEQGIVFAGAGRCPASARPV